jgi:hypothetical protein
MVAAAEDSKQFCRDYRVALDEHTVTISNLAKMSLSLTECLLIQ